MSSDGYPPVVYVTRHGRKTYHTDPGCPRLSASENVIVRHSSAYPDQYLDPCPWCAVDEQAPGPASGRGGAD